MIRNLLTKLTRRASRRSGPRAIISIMIGGKVGVIG